MVIAMNYEYDKEVDGLFIWFVDIESNKHKYQKEVRPSELSDEIGLLFDNEGKLMGLEILPASKYFSIEFLKLLITDNE